MRLRLACRLNLWIFPPVCVCLVWLVLALPTVTAQSLRFESEPPSPCRARALPTYTESALQPGGEHVYTLPELIDRAEKQNPDAKAAWESLTRAAATAGIAKSILFPTLSLTSMALRGDTLFGLPPNLSDAVIRLRSNIFQANLQGTYSGDFGANLNAYRSAKHLLAAQKASLNQTNQRVAFEVTTKYYDYITAKEAKRTAAANEEDSCLNLKYQEEQLRNGLTTIVSLYQARAKYLMANSSMLSARSQEANAKVGLAALLGLPPSESFDVAQLADSPPIKLLAEDVESFSEHALKTRPELVESAEQIDAAHALVRAARAKFFPTFNIIGQESYTNSGSDIGTTGALASQLASTNVKGNTYLYAGIIQWNFFDGGAIRNAVKAARASERQLRDSDQKSRLQIQQDVRKSYNNVLSAILNEDAASAALTAASEAWNAARISRENGLISEIELSSVRVSYITAQTADVQARANVLKESAQLAYATGDLLSTGAESPETIGVKP